MAEHGGYREPSNPAPVSGPGALSQRTDGGPPKMAVTGGSYGSSQEFQQQQSAAPLGQPRPQPASLPFRIGDPSTRPGEPVTQGADAGAGMDSSVLGLPQGGNAELRATLGPWLQTLMRMADAPTSTPSFRRQVRELIARTAS